MCGERHLSFLVAVGVDLPAEGDLGVLKAQQPVIGNRHAMGIASQIMQHVYGTAERLLGIDHPHVAMERPQILGERAWLRHRLERTMETELMPSELVLQLIDELTPKDFAERLDRQEEAV